MEDGPNINTSQPSLVILTISLKVLLKIEVDVIIKVEGKSKDVAISQKTLAPYTSLFDISTLSILDSIGGALMDLLNVTEADIDNRHATIE